MGSRKGSGVSSSRRRPVRIPSCFIFLINIFLLYFKTEGSWLVTKKKLQIIVIPSSLDILLVVGRAVGAYAGDTYFVRIPASGGLIFIFIRIVLKYQNCPQLMPESVKKNDKIVRD